MCGAEQRVKVIETFIRFGCSAVDVMVEPATSTATRSATGGKSASSAAMI